MTTARPLFSIITPVYQPPIQVLQATIDSVRAQSCQDWELILADDCSAQDEIREALHAAAASDPRIRVLERTRRGGISVASNAAIDVARGEFIALLDHDDVLTPSALLRMMEAVRAHPDADYLYSDEDKIDLDGHHSSEFRKPDWSPERFRHSMYTCHFSVLRTALVREVGGFRSAFDGSQDHDLVLRVSERARRIVHIPEVLYHWRIIPGSAAGTAAAKPYAWDAGRLAVQEHLDRVGIDGVAERGSVPGYYRIRRRPDPSVRVSIVMPTRGQRGVIWGEPRWFAVEAVRSALDKTAHTNLEIVVVYDQATPPEMLDALRDVAGGRLVLVPFTGPFNFSEKCNLGFLHSHGDVIVLLNDDVEAKSDRWLEALVSPLGEADVGLVGARLVLSDGTIQHAGHAYAEGDWHHPYYGWFGGEAGASGDLIVNRECSGVTAACMALRREVYEQVGGLSEALPVNFNDVDLSCKVRDAGYRVLCLADCELYHFESRTRDKTAIFEREGNFIRARWGRAVRDPFLPEVSAWKR